MRKSAISLAQEGGSQRLAQHTKVTNWAQRLDVTRWEQCLGKYKHLRSRLGATSDAALGTALGAALGTALGKALGATLLTVELDAPPHDIAQALSFRSFHDDHDLTVLVWASVA